MALCYRKTMCIILTLNKTKHGNDYVSQKFCGITSTQPRNKDKARLNIKNGRSREEIVDTGRR